MVGDHISEKQFSKFFDELIVYGFIKTDGVTRKTMYLLSDEYLKNQNIINEALNIGIKSLKDQGEI